MKNNSGLTVGQLIDRLHGLPREMEICFSGNLTFLRTKHRGDMLLQIEFANIEAELDPKDDGDIQAIFYKVEGSTHSK